MKKYTKNDNFIDLKKLPTRQHGSRIYTNWKECRQEKIPFKYENIEDYFYLSFYEYIPEQKINKVKLEYKENEIVTSTSNLTNLKIRNLILGNPSEYLYDVGTIMNGFKILKHIRITIGYTDQKGYLLLCLKYNKTFEMSEHYIKRSFRSPYVTNRKVHEDNWLYKEKDILKFLDNPNDAKNYTRYSSSKIKTKCPNCNHEKMYRISKLTTRGFSCEKCSSHLSYPEKLMMAILEQNNIKFTLQKTFDNLPNKRFDFYIPDFNAVIETHGKQHYKDFSKTSWDNLIKIQKSDAIKKEFCLKNNVMYIEIDCSYSEMDFIIKSVLNSEIKNIIKKIDKINLSERVRELSCYNNIKEIVVDYQNGMLLTDLASKYDFKSAVNVTNLLKRLGIFENRPAYNSKKVICLNNNLVFPTIYKASLYANLNNPNKNNIISLSCKGKRKTAGKHPLTGEPLKWMYYDEYLNQT